MKFAEAKAFGVTSSESGTPVTTSTRFRLGSTTKLFVALAVRVGDDRYHVDGGAQLETFVIVRDKAGAARFLCAETWALRKRS